MLCALCRKVKIEEGNYCDACANDLDRFFEAANYINGRNYDEEAAEEDLSFWDDLAGSFEAGLVVYNGKTLIAVGKFEAHYAI